jgi:REP element-mobilizing transposase RayT
MPHSYYKIWLHLIFSTKDRAPLLHTSAQNKIYEHLRNQLIEMQCPVRIINGMPDHIHLLFLQNPKMAVTEIVKQIKGNSSHWINSENITPEKFAWQTGYAVYSVSESQLERVYHYIRNQKEHHLKRTLNQEFEKFASIHGFLLEP